MKIKSLRFLVKMFSIFVIMIILPAIKGCYGNQCFKPGTLPNVHQGFKFNSQPFSTNTSVGPMDCLRICQLYSLCSHANFNRITLDCSLLTVNSQLISDPDYISIEVDARNQNMLGVCKNHECANNTVCKAGNADYYCEPVGCNGVPQVDNMNVTSFTSQALWGLGEMLEYVCLQTFFTDVNVTCLPSGKWSEFSCQNIQWCADTRVCSPSETKEFWLRRRGSMEYQKIHCSDAGPAITLPQYNMASTPPYIRDINSCALIPAPNTTVLDMGYTDFEKIRIKLYKTNAVYGIEYTNSTYEFQSFGRAGDCYAGSDSSACGVLGKFVINTRGTGLRVKSTVQWKTWGDTGVIMNITRSEDGHVIEGYCGGGDKCGGCEPDDLLLFEVDHSDTPPSESAEWPICRYPL